MLIGDLDAIVSSVMELLQSSINLLTDNSHNALLSARYK